VQLGRLLPKALHFENYQIAWERANFALYMWNSVRLTFISLTGTLLFCIPAAYAFARMNFVGKNVLFTVMLATMMIPEIVTLIPNFLTVVWLGRFGQAVCGDACAWIDNWPALTIPFMVSAFSIFLLRQFFMQIPNDLWDAAQIDGAGHVTFLRRVVLPLSRAPIMTVITFGFIGSWNALLWPILVLNREDWMPVAVGLSNFAQLDANNELQLQMAASVMMTLPILLLYFITQRQFTEGIASTGLKG
jgi:ABC-type glycerol-3-phosphate transport system permease component